MSGILKDKNGLVFSFSVEQDRKIRWAFLFVFIYMICAARAANESESESGVLLLLLVVVSFVEAGIGALRCYCSEKTKHVGFICMCLMSASTVLCENLHFMNRIVCWNSFSSLHNDSSTFVVRFGGKRRRVSGFIPYAKKKSHPRKRRSWWQKFFFDEDGNWLGLKDDDMLVDGSDSSSDDEPPEAEKFEAWKRRAEAIVELREAQEDMINEESRRWEDWLADGNGSTTNRAYSSSSSSSQDWDNGLDASREGATLDPVEMVPEKGFVQSVRDLALGRDDDDMLYEDRVFRYASLNSVSNLCVM